jgi:transcriptional regulator with XRE-family HTH domain
MLTQPAPASAAPPLDQNRADPGEPPLDPVADALAMGDAAPEAPVDAARAEEKPTAPILAPVAAPAAAPALASSTPPAPRALEQPCRAGDRLRAAREAAGLTIEQVSEKLRIRKDYLAALEDMNLKLLPGKAYALPYLRSYGAFLKFEPKALLEQFQAESALSREDATPQIRNPESKPERERPWIWALALALVAGGFVGYRALFGGPAEEAAVTPPGGSSVVAGAQRPVAPMVEGDGLPYGVAAQKVEIRALLQAWLEVRTPGGTVMLSQDLAPGQVFEPDAGAGWTLHARDGSAFEVFLNGASVGVLGLAGQPVLGRQVDAIAATAVKSADVAAGPAAAPLPGRTPRPAPPAASAIGTAVSTAPASALPPAPAVAGSPVIPSAPPMVGPMGGPPNTVPPVAPAPATTAPAAGFERLPAPRPAPRPRPPVQPRPKAVDVEPKAPVAAPPPVNQPDSWEQGETPPPGAEPR